MPATLRGFNSEANRSQCAVAACSGSSGSRASVVTLRSNNQAWSPLVLLRLQVLFRTVRYLPPAKQRKPAVVHINYHVSSRGPA